MANDLRDEWLEDLYDQLPIYWCDDIGVLRSGVELSLFLALETQIAPSPTGQYRVACEGDECLIQVHRPEWGVEVTTSILGGVPETRASFDALVELNTPRSSARYRLEAGELKASLQVSARPFAGAELVDAIVTALALRRHSSELATIRNGELYVLTPGKVATDSSTTSAGPDS